MQNELAANKDELQRHLQETRQLIKQRQQALAQFVESHRLNAPQQHATNVQDRPVLSNADKKAALRQAGMIKQLKKAEKKLVATIENVTTVEKYTHSSLQQVEANHQISKPAVKNVGFSQFFKTIVNNVMTALNSWFFTPQKNKPTFSKTTPIQNEPVEASLSRPNALVSDYSDPKVIAAVLPHPPTNPPVQKTSKNMLTPAAEHQAREYLRLEAAAEDLIAQVESDLEHGGLGL